MEEKVHCRNVEFHSLVSNQLVEISWRKENPARHESKLIYFAFFYYLWQMSVYFCGVIDENKTNKEDHQRRQMCSVSVFI